MFFHVFDLRFLYCKITSLTAPTLWPAWVIFSHSGKSSSLAEVSKPFRSLSIDVTNIEVGATIPGLLFVNRSSNFNLRSASFFHDAAAVYPLRQSIRRCLHMQRHHCHISSSRVELQSYLAA
jgi:hypothetical protein